MNEKEMNEMKEKIYFYKDEKIKVHIDLLNGTFLNGFILKEARENVFVLDEVKLGEVYVFLKEIEEIEQFRERGE